MRACSMPSDDHEALQRCTVRGLEKRRAVLRWLIVIAIAPVFIPCEQLHQRVRAVDHVARVVQEQGISQFLAFESLHGIPTKAAARTG